MPRGRPKKKLNPYMPRSPKQFCFLCQKRGIESEMKYQLVKYPYLIPEVLEYKCPICGYTKMES